jgi:hypothetical protein
MSWESSQFGISIVIMNRFMVHMMQDDVVRRSGLPASDRHPAATGSAS